MRPADLLNPGIIKKSDPGNKISNGVERAEKPIRMKDCVMLETTTGSNCPKHLAKNMQMKRCKEPLQDSLLISSDVLSRCTISQKYTG